MFNFGNQENLFSPTTTASHRPTSSSFVTQQLTKQGTPYKPQAPKQPLLQPQQQHQPTPPLQQQQQYGHQQQQPQQQQQQQQYRAQQHNTQQPYNNNIQQQQPNIPPSFSSRDYTALFANYIAGIQKQFQENIKLAEKLREEELEPILNEIALVEAQINQLSVETETLAQLYEAASAFSQTYGSINFDSEYLDDNDEDDHQYETNGYQQNDHYQDSGYPTNDLNRGFSFQPPLGVTSSYGILTGINEANHSITHHNHNHHHQQQQIQQNTIHKGTNTQYASNQQNFDSNNNNNNNNTSNTDFYVGFNNDTNVFQPTVENQDQFQIMDDSTANDKTFSNNNNDNTQSDELATVSTSSAIADGTTKDLLVTNPTEGPSNADDQATNLETKDKGKKDTVPTTTTNDDSAKDIPTDSSITTRKKSTRRP